MTRLVTPVRVVKTLFLAGRLMVGHTREPRKQEPRYPVLCNVRIGQQVSSLSCFETSDEACHLAPRCYAPNLWPLQANTNI